MYFKSVSISAGLLLCLIARSCLASKSDLEWLIHYPTDFHSRAAHLGDAMVNVASNKQEMEKFEKVVNEFVPQKPTDGETIDAIEHFFWGMENGLAIELGALDGSANTMSQTLDFEKTLSWRRILIEGNPTYKKGMIELSPKALSVNAAICEKSGIVHFSEVKYVGGLLEFMTPDFFKIEHSDIYNAGTPPGNISSVNWKNFPTVHEVHCVPLHVVLHAARARHVNFFVLDVEGGEMGVLQSINWSLVKFDVLCIETSPRARPPGYGETVTKYLEERGYLNHAGQVGRNMWFVRKDFTPSVRPGVQPNCYNGAYRSSTHKPLVMNETKTAFDGCKVNLSASSKPSRKSVTKTCFFGFCS